MVHWQRCDDLLRELAHWQRCDGQLEKDGSLAEM
jgi:hypothetical protein